MEKLNGVVETYYDNGQLMSRANYEDDKLNGLYETWYDNGQLWSRTTYKEGKLDGLSESWYENGQPWIRATYKDGVVEFVHNKHKQNMVEQESIRNVSEEELLRLRRKTLAMEIMLLRDKQVADEITFKESLKQSVRLIEEYDQNKIEEYAQQQVKSCAIPLVSNSLDLCELERKLDEALGKETRETLTEWLKQQRQ